MRRKWSGVLAPCALAILALLIFRPVLEHELLMFDDDINLEHNPHLGQFTWARVLWAFHDDTFMPRYMPLGWLQLMAAFEFGGLSPGSFHVFNLFLHAANAVLFLVVLRRFLARVAPGSSCAEWAAVLLAAMWAVHPLRVEPVAWATGVHYVHASTWALLALWLALGDPPGRARKAAALVCFACSGLVYPVALGLPVALAALWLWEKRGRQHAVREVLREVAPWGLVSALLLGANVWARFAVPGIYPPSPALADFGLVERSGQAARALAYYLVRPLWAGETEPVRDELFRAPVLGPREIFSVVLLAGGLLVFARRARRGRSGALLFFGAFAGVAAPYLGLLESPFQTSDRYTYFPSLLWCAGIAILLARARPHWRWAWGAAGGVCVFGLLWATADALPKWRSSPVFFERVAHSLEVDWAAADYRGRAAIFHARRGDFAGAEAILARMLEQGAPAVVLERGRVEVASLRAQAVQPTLLPGPPEGVPVDARAAWALARAAVRVGEKRSAERRLRHALKLAPGFHDARHDLVVLLVALGRLDDAKAELTRLETDLRDESRTAALRAFLIGAGGPGS